MAEQSFSALPFLGKDMFNIKIADIIIGIRNKYDFVRILCEDYIVCEEPEIIITATDNEIEEESRNNHSPKDYCESICIYRKICREIIKFNCFMLHASLISFDGKGYAFSAPSGYGKSTHARLWRGYFGSRVLILNGDKPIIKYDGKDFYAFGTPWCGKENDNINTSVILKSIFFVEKSNINLVCKSKPKEITSKLLEQIIFPLHKNDMINFMSVVDSLIKTLDFYNLKCNISFEAVKTAYNILGSDKNDD